MASSWDRSGMVTSINVRFRHPPWELPHSPASDRSSRLSMRSCGGGQDPRPEHEGDGNGEEEAVELVEEASRGTEHAGGVLHADPALHQALEEIAGLGGEVHEGAGEET